MEIFSDAFHLKYLTEYLFFGAISDLNLLRCLKFECNIKYFISGSSNGHKIAKVYCNEFN